MVSLLLDEAKQLPKEGVMKMRVLPMYGALPAAEQMRVFERAPKNCRKVCDQITNRVGIANTSGNSFAFSQCE